jgi:catechol 2,3-dioxygenase-like lactoylglutathione lyase family enzyme
MPKTTSINHVALHVADVAKSVRFYVEVMQFEQLPRPAFDFDGAWFRLGTVQELHLIAGRQNETTSGSRSNHFALEVPDLDEWQAHLTTQKAIFKPAKARPDGISQVFVQDPDGHFIELLGV